jgi:hypothetical protein
MKGEQFASGRRDLGYFAFIDILVKAGLTLFDIERRLDVCEVRNTVRLKQI